MKIKKKDLLNVIILASVLVSIFFINLNINNLKSQIKHEFPLSELRYGVGYQLCTEYTISRMIIDGNVGYPLENATSEQIQELIYDHPNGKIIDYRKCIGKIVTVDGAR